MKTLFTLLLVLSTSLIARENPFEATNAYEEEAARIIEMNEVEEDYALEYQQEQQYIKNMYEKMNDPAVEEKKEPEKPALTEEEVKKMIKKAQKETERKAETIAKKLVDEKPKEVEQVVYVKPRVDVTNEKELLPFVKVEYDNDKINIFSDYKVSKKITLPGEKKIVLDFDAKENFYTVREDLKSTNFPKVTVGNHKKDKFFRIVVELANMPDDYEVTYDDKMVTIVKLYE
ncbi:hypothetical protein CRV08_12205 [Halarcobacter ebronensis]|uniref:AMIN domain-containing protein n=1 Tax=Halarcobacter ebronensis TaxID=1462615 RepID=A0A4Q0YD57_9BACT|nr:AMIN domain-containing protein [Halarcobacter ebronensis]QKF83331.1 AMIN domain-containing protein [Halarcobacter ebronensis]RXJ66821.1 hypothetical protein CRV08_12205 [Halarcobacter ebronensis]RXK05893.1 hypothetical protein CRV07_07415 [Halarcobacter ebronensis]